jgi:micrococcal nuclease
VRPNTPVQCWSRRAARFTAKLVTGRRLVLVLGREQRDRYGRLLAYVRVAGEPGDLETRLLEGGYARPLAIPPNVDHAASYAALAAAARRAHRGLWGHCPP